MRNALMVLCLLLGSVTPAVAQISIHIGLPEASIGINLSSYPQFVRVPGYPVYYTPRLRSNFFFYDGLFWVYRNDNWYASYWYNGPWGLVGRAAVPLYILRIPVRYYRERPPRFSGWRADAPPRWGDLWGSEWQQQRSGWDTWNRSAVPAAAPLPIYQRQYSGTRYPALPQQPVLQSRYYQYQPREVVVQQFYQAQGVKRAPAATARVAPVPRQAAPQPRVVPQPRAVPQPRMVPQQPDVRKERKTAKEPRAARQPQEPRAAMQQPQAPRAVAQPQESRAARQPREPKAAKEAKQPKEQKEPKEPKGDKESKGRK